MNNLLMEVENEIAVVTINRPKSLNALNSETLAELDVYKRQSHSFFSSHFSFFDYLLSIYWLSFDNNLALSCNVVNQFGVYFLFSI